MTEEHRDPIEAQVAAFLDAEAAGVDGRALAARVRAARRARRLFRRVTAGVAAAALLALALGALLRNGSTPGIEEAGRNLARAAGSDARQAVSAADSALAATVGPLEAAVARMPVAPVAPEPERVAAVLADAGASLAADARRVRGSLGALFRYSMDKAGLRL